MLLNQMRQWLDQENFLGSPNPNNIVLATVVDERVPRSEEYFL